MKKFFSLFKIPVDESDLFLTFGTVFISIGMYLIYPPSAYITIGIIFLVIAWFQAKASS